MVRSRVWLLRLLAVSLPICILILGSVLPIAGLAGKVFAAGMQCSVDNLNPHTATTGTDTGFVFSISSSTDAIAWVRIISPSPDLAIDGASSDWLPTTNYNSSFATFSGFPIDPGNELTVQVNAQVGTFSPTNWVAQASNDSSGANYVNCSGNTSVSAVSDSPPAITSLSASATSTSATIAWTTDQPTTSQVDYGLTAGYGSSVGSSSYTTGHSFELAGLSPSTTYHYMVSGTSQANLDVSSSDGTFVTSAPPPPPSSGSGTGSTPIGSGTSNPSDKVPPTISITTAIPKVTKTTPKISGTATDNVAVAKVEYSTDGGQNWLAADTATGLGTKKVTFSFTPLNLTDGTYQIVARAIDGGGNTALTSVVDMVIDRLPPLVGGNVISLGPQILQPDSNGVVNALAGVNLNIHLGTTGGATSVDINAMSTTLSTTLAGTFSLHKAAGTELWNGLLSFTKPGTYQLVAHSLDGAGNATTRTIGTIFAARPGTAISSHGPINGAQVTVYYLDPDSNSWIVWDGAPYDQMNPQRTNKLGAYTLFLPAGTYYLRATTNGLRTLNSASFTLKSPSPVTAALNLQRTIQIGPLTLPWLTLGAQQLRLNHETTRATTVSSLEALRGTTLAGFSLSDTNGNAQNPVQWLGKPTVVSVMSTWAPTTAEQLDALGRVAKNNDVNVKLVGLQDSTARLRAFNAIDGSDLAWLADPDSTLTDLLRVGGLPTHYFVDRKGIIQHVITGVMTDQQLLDELSGL